MRETWVWSLDREDPLEKEMAIHSSTIAWKIPWTEEPGRLQSKGSQRVRHNWATSLSLSVFPSDRGWDGWMASPTQWTWVWVNSGRWWRTGKPGVLHSMGMQRVRHNLATKQLINYLQNHSFSVRVYIYNIHVHECVCMWVAVNEQWFSCCWGRGIPSPDIWQCLEGLFYCSDWVIFDTNNSI